MIAIQPAVLIQYSLSTTYFTKAGEIKKTDANLIKNGTFTNNQLSDWSYPRLGWSSWQRHYYWNYTSYPYKYAVSVRTPPGSNYNTMSQSVDLTAFASSVQSGVTYDFSSLVQCFKDTSIYDEAAIEVKFYDSAGVALDSQISSWVNDSFFRKVQITGSIPSGAATAIVHLHCKNNEGPLTQAYFDDVQFSISASSITEYRSNIVYEGQKDYPNLATHDLTDETVDAFGRCWSTRKTLWYKFQVDSTGYIYYNMKRNAYPTTDDIQISSNYINLYRYDESGDTINGLTHIRPISTTVPTAAMGRSNYACVSPGTYYFRVENCVSTTCLNFEDYLYPRMMFNFHTGDFCENAIDLEIDTLELVKGRALINCHTIGNDFGEDGSDLGCLQGPDGYKSTWFKVDYQDTAKIDLEFKLAEFTNAKASDIRYRTYYGNCKSLTPAPCNNNALTSFVLDCLRKGTYYVQVVSPESATGELEMSVEAKENKDSTCKPVDIFKPNAAFTYKTSCPENVVEFINTSSRGDSISYLWDFGYNNLTDTILNPVVTYPPDGEEKSYTVKLIVQHRTRGSMDSLELSIDVPFAPDVRITSNDTLLCEGDSVKLEAYISHDTGYWHTGDTATTIWAKETGWYYFDMVDKPQLIQDESFEARFASTAWKAVGSGTWDRQSSYDPIDGRYSLGYRAPTNASTGLYEVYQDVDVSADSLNIDSGISKNSVSGYVRGYLTSWAAYSEGNEAQMIVEYYDSNNTLLAQNASGLSERTNSWDYIDFNRTTPKYTRTIRIRLQISKTNQSYDNAYIFFDKISLKMRSSCNYLDSVYVQVNRDPNVALPNDTFFCLGDSLQLNPVVNYVTPFLYQDSFSTSSTANFYNSAELDTTNKYAILANNRYERGQIEWVDSSLLLADSFTISFDMYMRRSTSTTGYLNSLYLFNSSTPINYNQNTGGYKISFRETGSTGVFEIYWNNSRLTSQVTEHLATSEWYRVKVVYNNRTFKIYLDGRLVASYTDNTTRTQAGFKFGILGGQYSYSYTEHRIKNFWLSKETTEQLTIPQTGQPYVYSWSNNVSTNSITVRNTDTLSLQVTDKFGCVSNSDTVVVEAVRQYDSLFSQEERVCSELDSFQLQLPVPNGYFYGTATPDSAGLVRISLAADYGENEVYYAVIDSFGCLLKDTGSFRVDSVPEIEIDTAGPFCKNDAVYQLQVNDSNGYFYGGAFVDSTGAFNPALANAGTVKVYYETFGFGCTGIDSLIIQVDTVPDASITLAGPFCENGGMQLITPAVNTGGWFTNTSYLDSAGNFNPALATAGSHQVYYTFTDGNGCTDTDSTTILVDTIPDASITAAGPFCENGGIQTLSGAINTGGWFTNTSYLDSAGNFNPAIAQAGSHQVYYTFTDGNGCTDSDSTTILVDTIPDASITPAGPFCENGGMQTITPAINTGGWFTNTSYLDSAGNFNPALATAGSHLIYYTFTDGNGCTETDSTTILIDTIPDASIAAAGPLL
jgi:hypothetical protein